MDLSPGKRSAPSMFLAGRIIKTNSSKAKSVQSGVAFALKNKVAL
jgi:hypothetical protein